MKAVRIHSYGGAEQLKVEEIPQPTIGPEQVLVRIHDAGVNPVDWKIRQGLLKDVMPAQFPLTMGQDIAGEVVDVGGRVTRFSRGDRVFGWAPGAYAELACVSQDKIAKLPDSITFEVAASLPTAGVTAYQIIVKTAKASEGQLLLIHGAAGGVGSLAVQIARDKDANVCGTASSKDLVYLRELGVSQAIDYTRERFEEIASGIDVVVDLIGGDTQTRSFGVLKKGGLLITTVGLVDQELPTEHGVRAVEFFMEQKAEDLEALVRLLTDGLLKPKVGQVIPLEKAMDAQRLSESGKARGKIILKVA